MGAVPREALSCKRYSAPATAPFEVRFIENQPVVTRIFKASPAQPGDIILKIDGKPVQRPDR